MWPFRHPHDASLQHNKTLLRFVQHACFASTTPLCGTNKGSPQIKKINRRMHMHTPNKSNPHRVFQCNCLKHIFRGTLFSRDPYINTTRGCAHSLCQNYSTPVPSQCVFKFCCACNCTCKGITRSLCTTQYLCITLVSPAALPHLHFFMTKAQHAKNNECSAGNPKYI